LNGFTVLDLDIVAAEVIASEALLDTTDTTCLKMILKDAMVVSQDTSAILILIGVIQKILIFLSRPMEHAIGTDES
jgi:hypothetical protein